MCILLSQNKNMYSSWWIVLYSAAVVIYCPEQDNKQQKQQNEKKINQNKLILVNSESVKISWIYRINKQINFYVSLL